MHVNRTAVALADGCRIRHMVEVPVR
jgi:hypothetical protein